MSTAILSLVLQTLKDLNEQQVITIPSQLGTDTSLFGRDGILDSLALVTVIVAVEQAIEDTLGHSVSLADEKALSQRSSPFRTVGSLAAYASQLIHNDSQDG